MSHLTLSEIWIYPIKSLGGISMTSATVLPKGLQYDRRWMLVDKTGTFLTQRSHPVLALFKTKIDRNALVVSYKGSTLELPLNADPSDNFMQVKIWNDEVQVSEVNAAYSHWFSQQLQLDCKLVFFPEPKERPVDQHYAVAGDHVSLADGFPFLIIGQESLNDLNKRLAVPLPMNRFRPNFVFTNGTPFDEDTWNEFSIGTTEFVAVKPCARCVLTTVDQESGIKGKEPLATLATFRMRNNKIYFGNNLIARHGGVVRIGDRLHVHSYV